MFRLRSSLAWFYEKTFRWGLLGKQEVELRHAPNWQLALGNAKPGQVIRALAWLGPEKADAAASRLSTTLNSEERAELARVVTRMPDWLAITLGRIAHGRDAY